MDRDRPLPARTARGDLANVAILPRLLAPARDGMRETLLAAVHSERLIRKSRFIGCVEPMADRAGALERVAALRQLHPNATHVCWALLAGGQSAAVDDGEPSGTAGRPMLEVLRHHSLDGVLATVVRYFGGVKLGAGGLVRAYTEAVATALLDAQKVALQRLDVLECVLPYALEGLLRRRLASAAATQLEVKHGNLVEMCFCLPADQAARFIASIDEETQGRLLWVSGRD